MFDTEVLDEFSVYPALQLHKDLLFASVEVDANIGVVAVGQYVFKIQTKG